MPRSQKMNKLQENTVNSFFERLETYFRKKEVSLAFFDAFKQNRKKLHAINGVDIKSFGITITGITRVEIEKLKIKGAGKWPTNKALDKLLRNVNVKEDEEQEDEEQEDEEREDEEREEQEDEEQEVKEEEKVQIYSNGELFFDLTSCSNDEKD